MNVPLVSICCLAYNHEIFIRQSLDGFLMQKTNFSFEVLIHDDASPDKTADIIREYESKYPDIIKPIYQIENQYSKGVGVTRQFQFPRAQGKYIALCEGDDYWTDPLKLQKQVDFLEANEDYGLVFTDVNILNQKSGIYQNAIFHNNIYPLYVDFDSHLINRSYLAPCSWLCRKELLPDFTKQYCDGTFPWLLDVFQASKVHFMDEVTTVYRVLEESASHSKSRSKSYKFNKGVFDIQKDYIKKYNVSDKIKTDIFFKTYISLYEDACFFNDVDFINECNDYLKTFKIDDGILISELDKVLTELNAVRKSKAYRYGKLMLKPFSYIRTKLSRV